MIIVFVNFITPTGPPPPLSNGTFSDGEGVPTGSFSHSAKEISDGYVLLTLQGVGGAKTLVGKVDKYSEFNFVHTKTRKINV